MLTKHLNFLTKNTKDVLRGDIKDCIYQTKLKDTNPYYLRDGKGYRSCVSVYKYPKDVPLEWLSTFLGTDVYVTLDIAPIELMKIKRSIKTSVREQQDLMTHARDEFDKVEAYENFEDLKILMRELVTGKEQIFSVKISIYLYAHTLNELEEKQAAIIRMLSQQEYEADVMANEQLSEELQKWQPLQLNSFLTRTGQEMQALTLAGGYPFRFYDLTDPTGMYWGKNEAGGNVLFDPFTNDKRYRLSYNILLVGTMGAGKSATIFKLCKQQVILNNRVRIIDVTGEHEKGVRALGGKVLKVDGREVAFNPLTFRLLEKKEEYNTEDLEKMLAYTIAQASKFLSVYHVSLTEAHHQMFKLILNTLYRRRGFHKYLPTFEDEIIFSDVLIFVRELISVYQDDKTKTKQLELLQDLEISIQSLTEGADNIYFNQKSTFNYYDEPLICFVVRHITDVKEIFKPLMVSLLGMFWNELIYFGTEMKNLYDKNEISFIQSKKYLCLFDEAHHYINALNVNIVNIFNTFCREARKYFGGLCIASHRMKEFTPEHATSEGLEALETLFDLMQYKLIMKQDVNAKDRIRKVFGNELKEHHIRNINRMEKGQAILNIAGFQTMHLSIYLSDLEKSCLNGGV